MAPSWQMISLNLCVFGFLRELRPSEPFVSDFMVESRNNVTINDVNRYVFPIGTYSYAAQLVFVFLLTDLLRYKPLIIASGCAGIIVWSLLIWTHSLFALQLVEVFYGTYMATEVAYFTYIYAKVDKSQYMQVTAYTRATILIGRFVHSVLGQTLVYTRSMDYLQLNYITLTCQIFATLWAFTLPAVRTSIYFHRPHDRPTLELNGVKGGVESEAATAEIYTQEKAAAGAQDEKVDRAWLNAFRLLWSQFWRSYSNADVLIWSIWYAVAMCGFLQTISYVQLLWATIDSSQEIIWNGAVEAVNTLLGAGVALVSGYVHTNRLTRTLVLWLLAACSTCEGAAIVLASQTTSRNVSYVGYLLFYVLYSFAITVASAEVAKHLELDSYGLVFGINTLAALLLQTVLTLVCVSEAGLALSVIDQYAVLAGYFFVLAGGYVVAIVVGLGRESQRRRDQNVYT